MTGPTASTRSVRPPDLAPDAVRDRDVLAGWDPEGTPARLGAPPFPADTVVVGAAAVVGALLGGVAGSRPGRRVAPLVGGALLGAVVAGVVRRVWRSP